MNISSEYNLYPIIGNFYERNNYKIIYNMRIGNYYSREFDVIAFNNEHIIAIEVKLNNFNKTFNQALERSFYSDEVMIAFPEKYANYVQKKYCDILFREGIGLISIKNRAEIIINPKKSENLNIERKKKLLKKIYNITKAKLLVKEK